MSDRTASELRASAARLRELAIDPTYRGMGDALREVAAQFESEAKRIEQSLQSDLRC